jgi:hypothetical protein
MTFAPATARAEDDEEKSIWNLDKRIMEEVLYSFGLTKRPKLDQQIDYHERPRLTLPPGRELPAPQAVDPAAARRQEKPKLNQKEFDPEEFTNPIAPRELRASSGAGAPKRAGGSADPTDPLRPSQLGSSSADSTDPLPPSQLGSSGGFFGLFSGSKSSAGNSSAGNSSGANEQQEQSSASGAEPPRRSLIAPPPGYLTPSPTQPYGGAQRVGASRATKPTDHALGGDEGL